MQRRAFLTSSAAEAGGRVMAVLRQAFGSDVPSPEGMLRSRRADDPFSAGAYLSGRRAANQILAFAGT